MRSTKSKNKKKQIPSMKGRAAEATASIQNLIKTYFREISFDATEEILCDLTQVFLNPEPSEWRSTYTADVVFSVRRITNLLRKLEVLNNQMKGGSSCTR